MSNYGHGRISGRRAAGEFVETRRCRADWRRTRSGPGLPGWSEGFMPRNRELLEIRDEMQQQIDDWHRAQRAGRQPIRRAIRRFLREIGYLEPEPEQISRIETENLDPEIATICGPQLVVPVSNARYALNAANARWGSLYDALYGTDVIARDGELAPGKGYNPARGAAVFARAARVPRRGVSACWASSHRAVTRYGVAIEDGDGARSSSTRRTGRPSWRIATAFVGLCRNDGERLTILLAHNGLHVELVIDPEHPIGKTHTAHLADIVVESALTTIQDCEDSVAAVDAEDKVGVYRNWLGLMNGRRSRTRSRRAARR